jgi:hypothetical protein
MLNGLYASASFEIWAAVRPLDLKKLHRHSSAPCRTVQCSLTRLGNATIAREVSEHVDDDDWIVHVFASSLHA